MKENLLRNSSEIQREIPIKSSNPFLYEYWKVFSYLYFTKLSDKFIQINTLNYPNELLKSISLNNLMQKEQNNNPFQPKAENEKEKQKDTISLNSLNSLNNNLISNQNSCFKNGISSTYPMLNPSEMNNLFFQSQKPNILDNSNNYINPIIPNLNPNSQNNNIFSNYQPQNIQNISNQFYPSSNIIQNNFGKNIRPTNILNNSNNNPNNFNITDKNNIPYFQIPLGNQLLQPLPQTIISTNNIIGTSIPNNFMMTNNNNNINSNLNLNGERNTNNIKNIKNNSTKINLKNNNLKNTEKSKNPTENKDKASNPIVNNNSNNNNNTKNNNLYSKENNINNSTKGNNNNQTSTEKNPQPSIKSPTQTVPKFHKVIFNIKESSPKESTLLSKKRKRFIKNNKLVFVQMGDNELDPKNEKEYDEEQSLEIQKNPKPRGSRFRGVSKNGSQWQVLIMVKKKKRYLGSFANEEEAARAYDKVALQNHGNKAKTNYDYTKEEVEKIVKGPKLLKVE